MAESRKRRDERTSQHQTAEIKVPGYFVERVSQIPNGSATLLTALGDSGGETFLVPFVDFSLFEALPVDDELEPEGNEAFGRIMTLENAVYLMTILSSELVGVFADFETVASSQAGPEPTRFKAISRYLTGTRASLDKIEETLDRIMATSQEASASQPA